MAITADASLRTARADLDAAVARLRRGAPVFARLSVSERIVLAESVRAGYARIAERSVRAASVAKRLAPGTAAEGEEWIAHPFITLLHLRLWIAALRSIGRHGTTEIGGVDNTIDGRSRIKVFPSSRLDGVLFRGLHAEVHLQQGATAADRAPFYRRPDHDGKVVLVLGGGNVNSIPSLDVLTKMLNDGMVCLLKMNPVNAYLGPLLEEAFADPIRQNFLAVVYGGADEGAYLAQHNRVDEILITGSDRTYDLLVWGPPGPERDARRAENRPLLDKPITAELGNISPVLVVPGPYSQRQLAWQAENIAGGVTNNASFNCNANKMLITPRGWARRGQLLGAIAQVFERTPVRAAYYPGAEDRYQALTAGRATLHTIGQAGPGSLPWTVLSDLNPHDASEKAFRMEPFCAILSETAVDGNSPVEFLEHAIRFANEHLWGTLSATIVVHPATLRDPGVAEALERAIVQLRYGTVGINIWGAFGFALGTPWGGHPTSTPTNIQSGNGFVHNTAMLIGVEKTVVRHPLTVFPKPLHFPSHRTVHQVGRRLVPLEETGSWLRLPPVVAAAIRG